MIIAFATILAAVLLLIRVLFNPGAGDSGVDRGIGMILSFVSGIVAAAGGVMSYTAGGGNIKDLADISKIKGSFDSKDTTPPPPLPPPT